LKYSFDHIPWTIWLPPVFTASLFQGSVECAGWQSIPPREKSGYGVFLPEDGDKGLLE
jgi:hypothetical protein